MYLRSHVDGSQTEANVLGLLPFSTLINELWWWSREHLLKHANHTMLGRVANALNGRVKSQNNFDKLEK